MKTIKVMLSVLIGMVTILLTTTMWGNNVQSAIETDATPTYYQSNKPVAIVHLPAVEITGYLNDKPNVH